MGADGRSARAARADQLAPPDRALPTRGARATLALAKARRRDGPRGAHRPALMRIIAGSHKGARIFAPKGLDTRPTGDRVREAAFNLLGPGAAEGATVLDLFAGSGAMGLEALSRGAVQATFVENDREACRTIVRNLDKLGLERATVLCQDALTALRAEARAGTRYDLVLLDPPYR